jgi:hypothetical protein
MVGGPIGLLCNRDIMKIEADEVTAQISLDGNADNGVVGSGNDGAERRYTDS